MNSHERAKILFIESAKQGLDGPTETQVASVIHDAEEAVWDDIIMTIMQSKKPELAAWVEKLHERKLES